MMRPRQWHWVAAGVLLVTLTGALWVIKSGIASLHPPEWLPDMLQISKRTPTTPDAAAPDDRLLVLAMGVDERDGDTGRADTLIVASIDTSTRRVAILSIPRDTYVEIPEYGFDKINHAYAFGGEELMLRTVRSFLGLPIEHFAVINFSGFREVVDAVGGVEVEIPEPMHYEDPYDDLIIDFAPGRQTLSGDSALKYARYRADAEGDHGRIQRQQDLIKLIGAKALRPQTVFRLPAFVSAIIGAVRTDVPAARLLTLAAQGRDLVGTRPQSDIVAGDDRYVGGVYYSVPDIRAARARAYELLLGTQMPDAVRAEADQRQLAVERTLQEEDAVASAAAERLATPPLPVHTGPASPPGPAAAPADTGVNAGRKSMLATPPGAPAATGQPPASPKSGLAAALPLPPIVLVDASGKQLTARYTLLLRQRGYRVVDVRRGDTVADSLIIDNTGRMEVVSDLVKLVPGAAVSTQTPVANSSAGSITIRLGTGAR